MSSVSLTRVIVAAALSGAAAFSAAAPALAAPAADAAPVACTRYASPTGSDSAAGTAAAPLRTVQRLVDQLQAGETGCLNGGLYTDNGTTYVARFGHGGAPGRPLTLRSTPGQHATLKGVVYVVRGSDSVTISNLTLDGRPSAGGRVTSIQVTAADTVLQRNIITNRGTNICMVVGDSNGTYGRAARTIVSKNVFRDCGSTANDMFDHSIYVEGVDDAKIVDNTIIRTAGFAVHLYPDAHRTLVSHNVMVDNGGGVIFAGEGSQASSDNLVVRNVIVGSKRTAGISAWWGGPRGTGNVARDNCLSNTRDVDLSNGGFSAPSNVSADGAAFVDAAAGDYRLRTDSPCRGVFSGAVATG